jgi:type III pantothenate kinase
MLLAIDIGNSQTVFGLFDDTALLCQYRIATQLHKTADEYGLLFKSLLAERLPAPIRGAILSSVVPSLTSVFEETIRTYFAVTPITVTNQIETGITIQYHHPEEVGADRIVNSAAAFHFFGGSHAASPPAPLIVVDFGTATTFDVISEEGDYLGGAIAPGLVVSSEALFSHTAKLPLVELRPPKNVIGKETTESIRSGLIFGHVGLVNEIVHRVALELKKPPIVVATGGLAHLIAPLCKVISIVRPTLTLEGLMIIYKKTRPTSGRSDIS